MGTYPSFISEQVLKGVPTAFRIERFEGIPHTVPIALYSSEAISTQTKVISSVQRNNFPGSFTHSISSFFFRAMGQGKAAKTKKDLEAQSRFHEKRIKKMHEEIVSCDYMIEYYRKFMTRYKVERTKCIHKRYYSRDVVQLISKKLLNKRAP